MPVIPLFVVEGNGVKEEILSMPGQYRMSLDVLEDEIQEIVALKLKAVLLFAKTDDAKKDNEGVESWNPDGLMQRAIKTVKATNSEDV